jgi:hypothetical protein
MSTSLEEILRQCANCGGNGHVKSDGAEVPCNECAAVINAYELGIMIGLMDAYRLCEWQELMYVKDFKMPEANGARKSANAIWDVYYKRESATKRNMEACRTCLYCAHGECAKDLPFPGPAGCSQYLNVNP